MRDRSLQEETSGGVVAFDFSHAQTGQSDPTQPTSQIDKCGNVYVAPIIKGAADGVELGNLTELLNDFDAPIARADEATEGEANSSNKEFLNLAIEENVRQTIADLLAQSEVISDLVEAGDLLVVGGVYDLATGRVNWLDS